MSHCGILQQIDAIAEGQLPETLDELTGLGKSLSRVGARISQTMSVIVAGGRAAFGSDLSGWIAWCENELGIANDSYRCHLLKIGEMLRALRNADCGVPQYKRIFPLAQDKQLALARLPLEQLPAFLSHYRDLETMDRDKVRGAVSEWLGETVAPAAEQLLLPGLDKALDALVSLDEGKLLAVAASPGFDTVTAVKMTYSGVQLCRAAIGHLADHADELDDEMLDQLAENLDGIRLRLETAVTARRQRLLGNHL